MVENILTVERAMMTALTELAIALPTMKRSVGLLKTIVEYEEPPSGDEWPRIVAEARTILYGEV